MANTINRVEVAGDRFTGHHIPGGTLAELLIPARKGHAIVIDYLQATADNADGILAVFDRDLTISKRTATAAAATGQKDFSIDDATGIAIADVLYFQTDDGHIFGDVIAGVAALVITMTNNLSYALEADIDTIYERDKTAGMYSEVIGNATKTLNNQSGVLSYNANNFAWVKCSTAAGAAVTIDLCSGRYVPLSRA